ncbi:MAG TPA: 6-phosphogluconate dehydrogenase (decarboxylating), partial [Microbacterium sp.]|nr:6-phosphogluconate dehydrogenase (decarboxylating) [Microbacterium sp.]
GEGATGAESFADMASKLEAPRAIWLMIPAGLTGDVVDQVAEVLEPGDIIIDGGN